MKQVICTFDGIHHDTISSVVVSSDDDILLTLGIAGKAAIWNVPLREKIHVFDIGRVQLIRACLSPDNAYALVSDSNYNVHHFHITSKEEVRSFTLDSM